MQGFLLPRVRDSERSPRQPDFKLNAEAFRPTTPTKVEGGHEGSEYMRQELVTVSNFLSLVTMLDLMQSMFHLLP